MSPSRKILLSTAKKYISDLNEFDETALVASRGPECRTHCITPTYRATWTNQELREYFVASKAVFVSTLVEIVDECKTIVDESARKVVMHLKHAYGTTVGNYETESITVVAMDETGLLIDDVRIFTDSLKYFRFEQRLKELGVTSK